jgi:alkylhydroperoxidase family enzyme
MTRTDATGFLEIADESEQARRMFDHDVEQVGHVMNLSRVWAHLPDVHSGLFELMNRAARAASLSFRQRGVLVVACAATFGDAYCSLAWGKKLADVTDGELAGRVVRGDDSRLDETERALAGWARAMTRAPSATTDTDLAPLRAAGYDDARILAITVFVALRLAFASVNDALGVLPDRALLADAPEPVRAAVTYGRQTPDVPTRRRTVE